MPQAHQYGGSSRNRICSRPLARIIAFAIDNFMRGDRDDRGGGLGFAHFFVVMALEILLFIPGSMIIGWFSRQREFRADLGGAKFAGRDGMISALRTLQRASEINSQVAGQTSPAIASLKISSGKRRGFAMLMSTHPPLEERIARLERSGINDHF